MRNCWAVFKKEIASYFNSPVAYVVIVSFLVLMGLFFSYFLAIYTYDYGNYQMELSYYFQMAQQNPMIAQQLSQPRPPDFSQEVTEPFYFWLSFMMLFMLPMLTMRLFSEEKRSGTIEMLLTYPLRDTDVILGKYFACMVVLVVMIGLTIVFPLFINFYTEQGKLEYGPLALTYGGTILLGGAFIALGMFLSSLTRNQIIAAVVTFGVLFFFFFLWLLGLSSDFLARFLGIFDDKEFVEFFGHLSLFTHSQNFVVGLLDTRDLVFCALFIVASLFLCWFSLGTRKWRA